jgi:threonine dehydrogenase-like Zn-dependent dehydrogenase
MSLDTVVVSGTGPVGLGAIAQGVARGATVVAIESHPYRQKLARALGAVEVLDPAKSDPVSWVRGLTSGRGADGAIETSGAPGAAAVAARCLRVGGNLAIVAWTEEITLPGLVPLGIDVHGCWHWNHQRYATDMWATIRVADSMIDQLITHQMALDQISAAMDVQDAGECGKILLLPFGEQALR